MSKIVSTILICLWSFTVLAAEKAPSVRDKCGQTGEIAVDAHGFPMHCENGAWQDQSKAANVEVNILITKGESVIYSGSITTPDRVAVPVANVEATEYISDFHKESGKEAVVTKEILKTGVSMLITTAVIADNRIITSIGTSIVDLVEFDKITVGDVDLELPHTTKTSFQQEMVLVQDKPKTFINGDYALKVSAKVI